MAVAMDSSMPKAAVGGLVVQVVEQDCLESVEAETLPHFHAE